MKSTFKIIAVAALLTLANSAYAETSDKVNKEVKFQAKERGGYKSSAVTETTTEKGTKEIVKTTENVDVSKDGHVVGTVKTDIKVNPKGLLNETWKKEEARNEINPDGSASLEARSVSVDKTGTSIDSKLKTASEIAKDGTTKTTSNLKTTIDPKGMMNKQILETKRVTDKAADGTITTEIVKKVDGKVVEKKVE